MTKKTTKHDCKDCNCGYCDGGPCCEEMDYEMPVVTDFNRHEFIGRPRICGRPGCGIHEEGLRVGDSICKFSPGYFMDSHDWPEVAEVGEDYRCRGCGTRWSKGDTRVCDGDEEPLKPNWAELHVLPKRVQLAVTHLDSTVTYYPVGGEVGGWKIDRPSNCIIVGHGMGRQHIPLCNVRSFSPVEY